MADIADVTDQEFQAAVLDSETPVLVDFWADWCVPCRMVSPVVEEIGQDKGGALKVVKLNIDDNPAVTRKYGVMSIPTLLLFKKGEEVARVVGARPKDAILRPRSAPRLRPSLHAQPCCRRVPARSDSVREHLPFRRPRS